MKIPFEADERMQIITGRIAVIFLTLTQTALLGIILFRRYVLGQGESYYTDIRIVLGISVFGYIAARLYYGAVLPVLSAKYLLAIYIGFVIFLLSYCRYGLVYPHSITGKTPSCLSCSAQPYFSLGIG